VRERSEDIKGVGSGVKLYYLDWGAKLAERNEQPNGRKGLRRSGRSLVSVRSTLARLVKVETVAAWGGVYSIRR